MDVFKEKLKELLKQNGYTICKEGKKKDKFLWIGKPEDGTESMTAIHYELAFDKDAVKKTSHDGKHCFAEIHLELEKDSEYDVRKILSDEIKSRMNNKLDSFYWNGQDFGFRLPKDGVEINIDDISSCGEAAIDALDRLYEATKDVFIELKNNINFYTQKIKMEKVIQLLIENKNIILHGAPGTGKTYLAKKIVKELNAVEGFVQFHPSYDYTDFVEGLRPIKKDGNNEIGFERKDGVFKAFCEKALRAYNAAANKEYAPKFVFVIDEINRGDMSKIFGELFFSVDPGYRGPDGNIITQYANLNDEPNEFDKALGFTDRKDYGHFFVPENVYVIGTMNDIDRSVESMDFAMRRRFAFHEITAEDSQKAMLTPKTFENILEKDKNLYNKCIESREDIKTRMTNLNEKIIDEKIGLSRDYQIGAAYFLKYVKYANEDEPFNKLWNNHIENVLKEYLRGTGEEDTKMELLKKAYGYPQK